MGFDNFAKQRATIDILGAQEYNDDSDFDGSWGIYDEPFLKRTTEELTKIDNPFFATIFTLSSHHPYEIPKKYESTFEKGTLPIHKSIRYADHSLKIFFEQASTLPWFKNTLFVITADHTATSDSPYYQNRQGMYSIPLLFLCQQIICKEKIIRLVSKSIYSHRLWVI
ncbi:MAG: sulfatase-like hydrolase/transferase [Bacteroidetes bacterium]|nr:sulfatase-like hydrolase/transferase [Bacteroidota bacterium]